MRTGLQRLFEWFAARRFLSRREPSPYDGSWWVEDEGIDSAAFFRLLPAHFPEATTLYVEGTSIAEDVLACYGRHAEAGEFLAERGTIFPRSQKLRCRFSAELCAELAALSEVQAEPELLDHLHVFKDTQFLLYWHDAFCNPFIISPVLPEERVAEFAKALGTSYSR